MNNHPKNLVSLKPTAPHRAFTRRLQSSAVASVAVLLFVFFATIPVGTALPLQGYFELDGNALASGSVAGDDWNNLAGASLTTGIIAEPRLVTDPTSFTTGGSKDDNPISSWRQAPGNNPDKDEILNAYAALYVTGNERYVFFGLDRYDNSGDANVGFWFFRQPIGLGSGGLFTGSHSDGDIFVASSFTNGGAVNAVNVYKWQSGALTGPIITGAQCTAVPVQTVCGIVNTGPQPAPWGFIPKPPGVSGTFPTSTFFEGGLNITALLPGTQCFSTFIGETRTSQSVGSVLKDFAMGSFASCKGSITISPQAALNPVTTNHVLTIQVNASTGGAYSPVANASVTASLVSGPGSFVGPNTCTTNALGQCTVTITSAVVGTTVVSASASFLLGGGTIVVTTNAIAPNSGPASKVWFKPLLATSTTTAPTPASIVLGQSIQDTADVDDSNGAPVTVGNVTFYVCPAGVFPCLAGSQLGTPVPLNLSGQAISAAFTPLAVGTYCFRGNYSGGSDALNIFSPSIDAGPNECFTVGKGPSSTTTSPSSSSIVLGGSVSDHVDVEGLGGLFPDPTGMVTFYVCAEGVVPCASGGTQLGSPVAIDANGEADSADYTPLETGSYCFRGEYSGDASYEPSNDSSILECFDVDPANSTTVTTPSSSTITLGESVHDSADVSGLGGSFPVPTGTTQFWICPEGVLPCEQNGTALGSPVPLVNGTASSIDYTPLSAGSYCFRADYSGDGNYEASSDGRVSECFVVLKADSSIVTLPDPTQIVLGESIQDTADVSGLDEPFPAPTGNVTFYVCSGSCASGGSPVGSPVAIDGAGHAESASITPTAAGLYCFRAEYSGDDNYNGSSESGELECFLVTPANSSIDTEPSKASITLGDSLSDHAAVTGLGQGFPQPAGTVTFYLCAEGVVPCLSGGAQVGSAVPLDANSEADSAPVTPLAAGDYCFRADYSGDANYSASSETGLDECFEVLKHSSTTVTLASNASIVLGESVHDNATILGGLNASFPIPSGNVTFFLCDVDIVPCDSGGQQIGSPVPLDAEAQASSDPVTPLAAGDYCFRGEYSGDDNYNASIDDGENECFEVTKAPSSTVTTPSSQSIILGESVNDSALVSGLDEPFPAPTGSVTFFLCDEGVVPCGSGGTQIGPAVPLVDGAAVSLDVIPLATGDYCFRAEYSGDDNYSASADGLESECFQVLPAESETVTSPAAVSIILGESNNDSALVSGLGGAFPDPTGSVTFYLCAVNVVPCASGGAQLGSPVPLDAGQGAVSIDVTPLVTGAYCFRGEYSGDANYSASNDSSILECFDVDPANSTTVTTPSSTSIVLGGSVSDNSTSLGLGDDFPIPSGTVTFFVCDEGVVPCTEPGTQIGSPVVLDANGNATSEPYMPLAAGDYCFRSEYSGDANYSASNDSSISECFEVTPAPSITRTLPSNLSIILGGSVHDDVTVAGLGDPFPIPTGSVIFYVCAEGVVPCGSGGTQVGSPQALNATGQASSDSVTPLSAGIYCFRAEYSGDANYSASNDSNLELECFAVDSAASNTTTVPSSSQIVLGDHASDSAIVSGLGGDFPVPTGTVTFFVCDEGVVPCASGGAQLGSPVPMVDGSAQSDDYAPLAAGIYCFRGEYSGDANYTASNDSSLAECFQVDPADSHTATSPANASIVLGGSTHDHAIVTGLGGSYPIPTGNVTFYLCAEGVVPCAAGGSPVGSLVALNASAEADSDEVTPLATGTYCFRAEYAGDANYNPSTDNGSNECFAVTPHGSNTTTHPSSATVMVGDPIHDDAVVESGLGPAFPVPSGNVTFYVCAVGVVPCASGGTLLGSLALVNGSASSADYVPMAGGIYCFRGEYSGDANYAGSSDASIQECWSAIKRPSNITTNASATDFVRGGSVHDNAIVSGHLGGPVPTGNVTFYVCAVGVSPCASGGTQIGSPVPLVAGAASSADITPAAAGTYCFRGEYSGDAYYNASIDAGANECFVVKAPALVTRTQGFWQTHTAFTTSVFNNQLGGTMTVGVPVNGKIVNTQGKLFGAYYSDIAKKTTGQQRTQIDKARMALVQQLVTAKLNCAAFGCDPSIQALITAADQAYATGTQAQITTKTAQLDAYNNAHDSAPIPPSLGSPGAATPKLSQMVANKVLWNNLPGPPA